MTNETPSEEPISISKMLRLTSTNSDNFLQLVANHIDMLEEKVHNLTTLVAQLESGNKDEAS